MSITRGQRFVAEVARHNLAGLAQVDGWRGDRLHVVADATTRAEAIAAAITNKYGWPIDVQVSVSVE